MKIILDGIEYYAYTASHEPNPDLETVVFVHGTAMDHTVWALQSRYFAYHGYNILAINLPGHNLSRGKLLPTIEDMGDWLGEIMSTSVGKALHLAGHSMGALIALQAASHYNDNANQGAPLRSLSLVGFSYPMNVAPPLLDAAKNDPVKAYSMMTQWSHASKIGGEPNPGFWSPGMQMSMMKNSPEGAVFTDLNACNNYVTGEQALEKITCPTLFISGQLDKMAPAKLAVIHSQKNDLAEITMIPKCGHALMSEQPDRVLAELKEFIGKNSSQP
ncbi:MAG: alpha/beta fold hydrolase [Gammaproteobacteria bacterium]|nr:alpha/beta fold hydrolase [Gammaproteobacteria bacterium]